MAFFNGTHRLQFDQKGRISIPASFRGALREDSSAANAPPGPISIPLVLRPSEQAKCIEARSENGFAGLRAELDKFPKLSRERAAMALVLFADAQAVETDKEGRVIIEQSLLSYAGISRPGEAVFMGLGDLFQIWSPEMLAAHKAEMMSVYQATVGLPGGA